MTELPDLTAGIWRHFKGHLYLVLGYANDANSEGRTVVVYVGLQLDGARHGERISVRTVEDFFAVVDPTTGEAAEPGTTTNACTGDCGDDNPHDAHLNADWDGQHWVPRSDPASVQRFTYVGPTTDCAAVA